MNVGLTSLNVFKSIMVQAASLALLAIGAFYAQRALDTEQTKGIEHIEQAFMTYKSEQYEAQAKRDADAQRFRDFILQEQKEIRQDIGAVGGDLREIKGMLRNRGF